MLSLLLGALACRHTPEAPPPPAPPAKAPSAPAAAISHPPLEQIAASYRSSYRLAASLSVDPQVAYLCRMPIAGLDYPYHSDDQAGSSFALYGGADATITVYAN